MGAEEEMEIEIDIKKEFEESCELWENMKERGHYLLSENSEYERISKLIKMVCENKKFISSLIDDVKYQFSEEDKNALEEFFHGSIDDLENAELLYENDKYASAIYHLQQSIEKLSKYWLMAMLHYNYSYVKNIGHKSPMAHISAIESITTLYLNNIKKIHVVAPEDLKEEPEKALKAIRKTKNAINSNKKELAELNKEKIDTLLDVTKNFREAVEKLKNKLYEKGYDLEEIIKCVVGMPVDDEDLSDMVDIVLGFYSIIFATTNLYILASITYIHEAPTRYVDRQTTLKPSDYKPGLGIVDSFPQIVEETKWIISKFEQFDVLAEKMKRLMIEYKKGGST